MPVVSMKELLEAGVHFGHQTRRWNPKMKPYIYDERNGIYIIDLHKTRKKLEEAFTFIRERAQSGGKFLFVGTKKQAQDSVADAAKKCGQYYVNQRWLGGMLTNWSTIKARIERMNSLQQMQKEGILEVLPKKESARLMEEMGKLEKVLGGIRDMGGLPDVVFVMDLKKEHIAVAEARKLEIPLVGLVDTNCDPDEVDYIIPGNDDAIRALKLMAHQIADAVLEGVELRNAAATKAESPKAEETMETTEAEAEAAVTSELGAELLAKVAAATEAEGESLPTADLVEPVGADPVVAESNGETALVVEAAEASTEEAK